MLIWRIFLTRMAVAEAEEEEEVVVVVYSSMGNLQSNWEAEALNLERTSILMQNLIFV